MEPKSISRRKFMCLAGIVGASTALSLAGCSNSGSDTSGDASETSLTVDENFAEMSWDDILAEADGQELTFCAWDTDVMVVQWWDYLQTYMADNYNITLNYVSDDSANEERILTDVENGVDATIDLFWGMGASMTRYMEVDGLFGNEWVNVLPNSQYLDPDDGRVTFDGTQETNAMEAPFQTLNPSLVYSQDLWDHSLAWDETNDEIGGLFHNFTELYQWVQLYPGKFTYMDPNGSGSFHARCFMKAILVELTDDGNGGWTAVYDEEDDEDTRREKIEAHNEEWYEWITSDEASEEAFYERAAYVWAYLNDLEPYLLQGDSGALYAADATTMMSYVTAGDLACTFTTCTSISSRIEENPSAYMSNPQIYMLQTSIGVWDYVVITSNSTKKAAALVVANAMLDPEQQAYAFGLTGNGYNVSYDLLDADQQAAFDEVFDSFIEGTSPSVEEIALNSYSDLTGGVNSWLVTGWDQYVNRA